MTNFPMIPEWLWNRLVEDRIMKPRSVGWSRALWGLKIIAKQNEKKEYIIEFSNGSKVICSPNLDEFRCIPARSGNLEHFKTLVPDDREYIIGMDPAKGPLRIVIANYEDGELKELAWRAIDE